MEGMRFCLKTEYFSSELILAINLRNCLLLIFYLFSFGSELSLEQPLFSAVAILGSTVRASKINMWNF